ncbi:MULTISPECIES: hypothetical protein [Streptomyces]|uniref:hypothetical protein n=1 Tax=Streptomyces TaxID=1883 RepID=UPI00123CBC12|nr:hypothetical protein [Streptomyces galilaeus]QEU65154.1 hypothetical protein CP966_07640 [Streptomyces galilaeus]GGW83988.1 hypothetical protein GCM10010350_80970 [Streptomyces galilaeus]
MNVQRNVKPHDLGDRPACLPLAVLFWSGAALIAFGPVLLLTLFSVAWAQPMAAQVAGARLAMFQVGTIAVLLTPLYFAPGVRRLARAARFALLGPLAAAIALAVLACLYRTLP